MVYKTKLEYKDRTIELVLAFSLLVLSIAYVSGMYVGETVSYTPSQLGLYNFTDINFTGNTSIVLFNLTNESMTLQIPNDYSIENFTITFYGYGDDGVIVPHPIGTNHHSGGGSYKPIIKPVQNQTNQTIQTNQTSQNNTNLNETLPKGFDELNSYSLGFYIAAILLVGIIISLIFLIIIKFSHKNQEPKFHTQQQVN